MSDKKQEAVPSHAVGQTTKKPKLSRGERFFRFWYNKDTNEICGRTGTSWIGLLLYYLVVYCLGGAFFVILLFGDYRMRDLNNPQHNLYDFQPFLQEPGLNVIPKGDATHIPEINVYDFDGNKKAINDFLAGYPKDFTIQDCRKKNDPKTCQILKNNQTLGPCSPDVDPNFGYNGDKLEPCVIVTVNKIWGWVPKLSNPTSNGLPIVCGSWPRIEDRDYKGTFSAAPTVYPTDGFSVNCFPFCGKKPEYYQPFVMVKFTGIDTSKTTAVICVLQAENIKDSRKNNPKKLMDQIGSIIFILNPTRKK